MKKKMISLALAAALLAGATIPAVAVGSSAGVADETALTGVQPFTASPSLDRRSSRMTRRSRW